MHEHPIRGVSFDAGNTLIYCDPSPPELYAAALSDLGRRVTPDEVAPVFAAVWEEMQRRTAPGLDRYAHSPDGARGWWGLFLVEVVERLGHDAPAPLLLDRLWQDFARPDVWHAYPEARPTLERLARAGLRLAVTSNWDERLPEILARLDLERHFQVLTVSHLEGVEKPAGEIFRRTLRRLGLVAAEVAHVGDSPREDYAGARDAGLLPVLVDRAGAFSGDGHRRVARLDELADLLVGEGGGRRGAAEDRCATS